MSRDQEIAIALEQTERLLKIVDAKDAKIAELEANSERLRKAAEKLVAVMVDALPRFDIIEQGRALDRLMKVMYDTPAQSLQAHDDELLEQCAQLCENQWDVDSAAASIRNLKGRA